MDFKHSRLDHNITSGPCPMAHHRNTCIYELLTLIHPLICWSFSFNIFLMGSGGFHDFLVNDTQVGSLLFRTLDFVGLGTLPHRVRTHRSIIEAHVSTKPWSPNYQLAWWISAIYLFWLDSIVPICFGLITHLWVNCSIKRFPHPLPLLLFLLLMELEPVSWYHLPLLVSPENPLLARKPPFRFFDFFALNRAKTLFLFYWMVPIILISSAEGGYKPLSADIQQFLETCFACCVAIYLRNGGPPWFIQISFEEPLSQNNICHFLWCLPLCLRCVECERKRRWWRKSTSPVAFGECYWEPDFLDFHLSLLSLSRVLNLWRPGELCDHVPGKFGIL